MVNIPSLSTWDHLDDGALDDVEVCPRDGEINSRRGIPAVEGSSKYGSGSAILSTSCKSDEKGCAMSSTAKCRDMTVTRRKYRLDCDETEATR